MMKRRTFFGVIAAFVAVFTPNIVLASKRGIPKPNNIKNDVDLNRWIESWNRTQYDSNTALVKSTSGRVLEHKEYALGVTVNINQLINASVPSDAIKEYLRKPSNERELLYKAVAQSIYAVVSTYDGDIHWRIRPEHDVGLRYEFIKDAGGQDRDYITYEQGNRVLRYGIIKHYCRFSIDNDVYLFIGPKHIDMTKREGGMHIYNPKALES